VTESGREKKEKRQKGRGKQPEALWDINPPLVAGTLLLAFVLDSIALFIPPLTRRYYQEITTAFRLLLIASIAMISGTIIGTVNSYLRTRTLNRKALWLMVAALIVAPLGYGAYTLAQHLYGHQVPPGSTTAELLDEKYFIEWHNYDMSEAITLVEPYTPGDAPAGVKAFYEKNYNRFWLQQEVANTFRHYGPFKGHPADVLPPPAEPDQE
jgi:hypothetical protein